jgi:hypothetical protein
VNGTMKAYEITWENHDGKPVTAKVRARTTDEAIWKFAFGLGQRLGLSEASTPNTYISCQEASGS